MCERCSVLRPGVSTRSGGCPLRKLNYTRGAFLRPCLPTHTFTHILTYTRVHTHSQIFTEIHAHSHVTHSQIFTHIHRYSCTYTHSQIFTDIHTHSHTCKHIHTHVHTHSHAYAHIPLEKWCVNTRTHIRVIPC